ncbi:MAG: LamG domain-containing protein [Planctomycetes bacterium]|nr:LamG domain-containing protein [Planctomycetota bacterium]
MSWNIIDDRAQLDLLEATLGLSDADAIDCHGVESVPAIRLVALDDDFDADTACDYLAGGDRYGWHLASGAKLNVCESDGASPGSLEIEHKASTATNLSAAGLTAPRFFKRIEGDFKIRTELAEFMDVWQTHAGLFAADESGESKNVVVSSELLSAESWTHTFDGGSLPTDQGYTVLSTGGTPTHSSSDGDVYRLDTGFIGANSYLFVRSDSGISNATGTTLEVDLKIDSVGPTGPAYVSIRDGVRQFSLNFFESGGTLRLQRYNGSWSTTPSVLAFNTWYRVRMTMVGGSFALYIDGALEDSGSITSSATDKDIRFGDGGSTAGANCDSYWDFVRYYIGGAAAPSYRVSSRHYSGAANLSYVNDSSNDRYLEIERSGNYFVTRRSQDGIAWTQIASAEITGFGEVANVGFTLFTSGASLASAFSGSFAAFTEAGGKDQFAQENESATFPEFSFPGIESIRAIDVTFESSGSIETGETSVSVRGSGGGSWTDFGVTKLPASQATLRFSVGSGVSDVLTSSATFKLTQRGSGIYRPPGVTGLTAYFSATETHPWTDATPTVASVSLASAASFSTLDWTKLGVASSALTLIADEGGSFSSTPQTAYSAVLKASSLSGSPDTLGTVVFTHGTPGSLAGGTTTIALRSRASKDSAWNAFSVLGTLGSGASTTFDISSIDFEPETELEFRAAMVSANGTARPVSIGEVSVNWQTDVTAPGTPVLVAFAPVTSGDVNYALLDFESPADPDVSHFEAQLSAEMDFSVVYASVSPYASDAAGGSVTSALFEDIEDGTYYARLRAFDEAGNPSAWAVSESVISVPVDESFVLPAVSPFESFVLFITADLENPFGFEVRRDVQIPSRTLSKNVATVRPKKCEVIRKLSKYRESRFVAEVVLLVAGKNVAELSEAAHLYADQIRAHFSSRKFAIPEVTYRSTSVGAAEIEFSEKSPYTVSIRFEIAGTVIEEA